MRNPFLIVAAALTVLTGPAMAQDRRVAVTFDDLPFQATDQALCDPAQVRALTNAFLDMLAPLNSRATAFVNEGRMCDDIRAEVMPDILNAWLDDGYGLGNHTFSHVSLHAVDLDAYEQDILRGEVILRPLLAERGQTLAQLAIAWVLRQPGITSALIGASSVSQLEDSAAAVQNPGRATAVAPAGRSKIATTSVAVSTSPFSSDT